MEARNNILMSRHIKKSLFWSVSCGCVKKQIVTLKFLARATVSTSLNVSLCQLSQLVSQLVCAFLFFKTNVRVFLDHVGSRNFTGKQYVQVSIHPATREAWLSSATLKIFISGEDRTRPELTQPQLCLFSLCLINNTRLNQILYENNLFLHIAVYFLLVQISRCTLCIL